MTVKLMKLALFGMAGCSAMVGREARPRQARQCGNLSLRDRAGDADHVFRGG